MSDTQHTPVSQCQRCAGKAADAYLCTRCARHVRALLMDLPWWLDRLTETALGQSRMSDNGGRRSARRKDLDGGRAEAAHIEALPGCKHNPEEDCDCDLGKARKARERLALAHALATGGINAHASELLGEIADSLSYWVRVLCEARGLPTPTIRPGSALGRGCAIWLRINLQAIALSEDAADITGDLESHQDDIVAAVNRRERRQFLGSCPTWDEDTRGSCGRRLSALPDDLEVHCRACKVTHNVARLQLALMDTARRETLTWEELLRVNRGLPDGYRVPERTLRHWRVRGRIKPAAWVRAATGRVAPTCHAQEDIALYRWGDVETLRVRCDTPV